MYVKSDNKDRYADWIFIGAVFVLYLVWALIVPFNCGPDERMRYLIPQYIYKYGRLPSGTDPEIRDALWGISYAYYPMLSYMISGLFMRITGVFSNTAAALLLASRMTSVLFSVGTAFFCLKIGRRLFKGAYVWLFVILVTFLPQFAFISSYTSNEAFSIFSVAWVTYGLILGTERKWDIKSTLFLGVGISICVLSYYSAYGIIVSAVVYAVISVIIDKDIKNKNKVIWSRIGIIFLIGLILTGWWFVRNYIIYDGDFLGMATSSKNAELYAIERLKPSNRVTPHNSGYSLKYMLIDMGWIRSSVKSFVAVFGYFEVWAPQWIYNVFYTIGGIGLAGAVLIWKRRCMNNKSKGTDILFAVSMVIMCIFTLGISIYYSYNNDFEPQGRYFMPIIIALAFFITGGWKKLLSIFPEKAAKPIVSILCMAIIFINLYVIVNVLVPQWY